MYSLGYPKLKLTRNKSYKPIKSVQDLKADHVKFKHLQENNLMTCMSTIHINLVKENHICIGNTALSHGFRGCGIAISTMEGSHELIGVRSYRGSNTTVATKIKDVKDWIASSI